MDDTLLMLFSRAPVSRHSNNLDCTASNEAMILFTKHTLVNNSYLFKNCIGNDFIFFKDWTSVLMLKCLLKNEMQFIPLNTDLGGSGLILLKCWFHRCLLSFELVYYSDLCLSAGNANIPSSWDDVAFWAWICKFLLPPKGRPPTTKSLNSYFMLQDVTF